MLYQVVQENLATFLAQADADGRRVPGFVRRGLEKFLDCGILGRGFVRIVCDDCKDQHLVAMSCKVRGLCPSCGGRRMSESAAHLVDNVLPRVPVRQWVLSLPIRLRYILAYNADLCAQVLNLFLREVYRWYRWTAKIELGLDSVREARCGSVTFIQRADSGLRLNLHFHTLAMDGVYVSMQDDWRKPPTFFALSNPTDEAIAHVAIAVRRKVLHLLEQAGHDLGDPDAFDDFAEREPLLAACSAASVTSMVTTGRRAGQAIERLREPSVAMTPHLASTRCVNVDGFSLHANVRVRSADRKALEKLCRYAARPPIANDRLQRMPDGKIAYHLKRIWSDGSSAILFEPLDLVAKLLPIIPPPMVNQTRYHGVLAPADRVTLCLL
ncbi:MAG: transposase [Gemmatimonadetes bacterium]|nr:transposase [Gemmatimonadota bacterium]